ncbi:MAG: hypothetical protein QM783_18360 [Phycisphaerales bacterium]
MPLTVNSIGTRYSGSTNVSVRRDRCQHCGRVADLSSYDTRLYFVVLFLPIIPLARKRIINQCSACTKHYAMPIEQWEKQRLEKLGGAVADWSADRDNVELATRAVGMAVAFEAREEFAGMTRMFTPALTRDRELMATVGDAYGHFGMREEQIASYRAAIAVSGTPLLERALGVQLLNGGQTDEGVALIRSAVRAGVNAPGPSAFAAVGALQTQGRHGEALEVLGELAQASPGIERESAFKKMKKVSEKNREKGTPVKSYSLPRGGWQGGKDGMSVGRKWAWIGGVAAVLGVISMVITTIAHTYVPDVWLVNGLSVTEKVSVDGKVYTLMPLAAVKVSLAQGSHEVKVVQPAGLIPDQTIEFGTSWLERPFVDPTFALNPDELGVILERTIAYSANGQGRPPNPKWELHWGKTVHSFRVDYGFVSHPSKLQLDNSSSVVTRTKVDVFREQGAEVVLGEVFAKEGEAAAKARTIKGLTRDPWNDGYAMGLGLLDPAEIVAVLEPLLKVRPVVANTHRLYQEMRKRVDERYDLHAQYKAMYDADPKDPALAYLLGRVSDREEHDRLFSQAAAATPVVPAAVAGWSQTLLDRGEFAKSAEVAHRCREGNSWNETAAEVERYALIGQGKLTEALALPELSCIVRAHTGRTALEAVCLLTMTGKVQQARQLAADVQKSEVNRPDEMSGFLGSVCDYAAGDVAAAATALAGGSPELDVKALLMRGKLIEAAKEIDAMEHPPFELLLDAGACAVAVWDRKLGAEYSERIAKYMDTQGPEGKVAAQLLRGKIDCTPEALDKVWLDYRERAAFMLLVAAAARPENSEEALRAAEAANKLEVFPSREVRAGIDRVRRR